MLVCLGVSACVCGLYYLAYIIYHYIASLEILGSEASTFYVLWRAVEKLKLALYIWPFKVNVNVHHVGLNTYLYLATNAECVLYLMYTSGPGTVELWTGQDSPALFHSNVVCLPRVVIMKYVP